MVFECSSNRIFQTDRSASACCCSDFTNVIVNLLKSCAFTVVDQVQSAFNIITPGSQGSIGGAGIRGDVRARNLTPALSQLPNSTFGIVSQ